MSSNLSYSLLRAIREGDFDMIQFLVRKGANVNYCDEYGDTPLKIACEEASKNLDYMYTYFFENRMRIARFLIDNGGVIVNE